MTKGGTLPITQRVFSKRLAVVFAVAILAVGCAAGQAFRKGEVATRSGDLDGAVAAYRTAVQAAPENASFKIALQRAMLAASRAHLDRAREYEKSDQLEAALGEYKQASEYDPSNRLASAKITNLDRTIRDRVEAARPKPAIQQARERARASSTPAPLLNFTTALPLIRFNNVPLRDILSFIGTSTGINVTYDRQYQDRNYTIQLDGVTLEQALNQILGVNQLSYKVLSERSILIFDDSAEPGVSSGRHRDSACYRADQDAEFHHHPCDSAGARDLRKADPAERQATSRDRRRRRDHGSEPEPGEAVRPQPVAVRDWRAVLA